MQAASLVDALKRLLKAQGITYAQVAAGLGLSEAGVKRMFSRGDFTLQRLEDVCRIARVDLGELARAAADEPKGLAQLSIEQERELVSDPRLMLVALCAWEPRAFRDLRRAGRRPAACSRRSCPCRRPHPRAAVASGSAGGIPR
jgi:transcriptional regulator with XRE-family HTH domain